MKRFRQALMCTPRKHLLNLSRQQDGMTLIELGIVLVIIAIVALFAAPDVMRWKPNRQLKAASDQLYENLQQAKIHALKNNRNVLFKFTVAATCPGGSYTFYESEDDALVEADDPVILSADLDDFDGDGVKDSDACLLSSTFAAPDGIAPDDGFTSRGLPIVAGTPAATISHIKIAATGIQVSRNPAGGLSLNKVSVP